MGRVTEFIHYINLKKEPTPFEKMTEYSHISFTEEIQKKTRKYRKKMKEMGEEKE